MRNIEEILFKSIRDIENGVAKTTKNNGRLPFNTKLTKSNVSYQSAEYTPDHKPISRATIDKFKYITQYIDSSNNLHRKIINDLKDRNYMLQKKNEELELTLQKIYAENDVLFRNNRLLIKNSKLQS